MAENAGHEPRWLPPRAPGAQAPPRFVPPAGRDGGAEGRPAGEDEPELVRGWLPPSGAAGWREHRRRAAQAERDAVARAVAARPTAAARAAAGVGTVVPSEPVRPPARPAAAPPAPAGAAGALAVASIALGTASIALLLLSLGLGFLFSLPLAGAGWLCGLQAQRRVREGSAPPARAGQARAGVILCAVAVGLAVVAMVVWIVLLSSGFSLDELRDQLQREVDRRRSAREAAAAALAPFTTLLVRP